MCFIDVGVIKIIAAVAFPSKRTKYRKNICLTTNRYAIDDIQEYCWKAQEVFFFAKTLLLKVA